jgi:GTPase SAR1 family protein
MVKIFILGTSQSGKTTLAKAICQQLPLQHVSASTWIRKHFHENTQDKQTLIASMTAFATQKLKLNPFACIEELQKKYDLNQPSVIEGIRNPFDFANLFDPNTDRVIRITYKNNKLQPTEFEKGLEVVDDLLTWMINNQMMTDTQVLNLDFEHFRSDQKNHTHPTFEDLVPLATEFARRAV